MTEQFATSRGQWASLEPRASNALNSSAMRARSSLNFSTVWVLPLGCGSFLSPRVFFFFAGLLEMHSSICMSVHRTRGKTHSS